MCRFVDGVLLVNMIQNNNVITDEIPAQNCEQSNYTVTIYWQICM